MIRRNYRSLISLITALLVISCVVPAIAPESVPVVATFDPNSVNISIAQTANAAGTRTAQAAPPTFTATATLVPTSTVTETPTPTFIFILATATIPSNTPTLGPANAEYACRVESQNPADGTGFAKGADFDAKWTVVNIGTNAWSSESSDYRYVSGDKFHQAAIYDLEKSVKPAGQIDIIVDMKAPANSGTYTTTWQITVGKNRFCNMKLTIVVN